MATLARRALKVFFFIILSMVIARGFDIYSLISVDTVIQLSYRLFGEGGQENVEGLYALIDTVVIFVLTTVIYLALLRLYSRLKK